MTAFYHDIDARRAIEAELLAAIKSQHPRVYRHGPNNGAFRELHTDLSRPQTADVSEAWTYWMSRAGDAVLGLHSTPERHRSDLSATIARLIGVRV